jgi:hypothetical protein
MKVGDKLIGKGDFHLQRWVIYKGLTYTVINIIGSGAEIGIDSNDVDRSKSKYRGKYGVYFSVYQQGLYFYTVKEMRRMKLEKLKTLKKYQISKDENN